jgi:hypothetical protein
VPIKRLVVTRRYAHNRKIPKGLGRGGIALKIGSPALPVQFCRKTALVRGNPVFCRLLSQRESTAEASNCERQAVICFSLSALLLLRILSRACITPYMLFLKVFDPL